MTGIIFCGMSSVEACLHMYILLPKDSFMSAWKCSLIARAKKHERRGNWVGRARTEVFQRVRLHFENILSTTTTYDEISGSESREKFEFESSHSALNAEERFPVSTKIRPN